MAVDYLKGDPEGKAPLTVNYDYRQVFHLSPLKSKAIHEAPVIKRYLELPDNDKRIEFEILALLGRFGFASKEQLHRLITIKGYIDFDFDDIIRRMVREQRLNYFIFAAFETDELPEDAERIYCLGIAAKHILSHYFSEVFVWWKSTDNARSAEQVIKCLSTLEFYLALLYRIPEKLRSFEPLFRAQTKNRDMIFSALIEIKTQSSPKRYILESVRDCDVPEFFRKKTTEQISPFILGGFYKNLFSEIPEFIMVCENKEIIPETADIFYRRLEIPLLLTTDEEVRKGMENAAFYRYDRSLPDSEKFTIGQVQGFVE